MLQIFSEYLSPTNPIAYGIVIFLLCVFILWIVSLIVYVIWLFRKRKQIIKNQNVQPLVVARQERDLVQEDSDTNIIAEKVFREFCEKQKHHSNPFIAKHLSKIFPLKTDFSLAKHLRKFIPQRKDSDITKHLRTIFFAGWNESRLEVSELINHTTSNLFRFNNLLRSVLAVFIVIGLLGTLFGLTDSLTDLSPALKESTANETNTENSERMTQALGNLMDDIKGAFAPSICGIIFTVLGVIFYGFYLQIACHPVKAVLERLTLTVWVPQLYPTTSQKLMQTLQKSESQMQKGFDTAAQFSDSVQKVHGNIDDFNESLTHAIAITQPLSDSVTQINKAASDISTAADVLNTGFTESLDKFSSDFASSVTQLTGFQDEIRNLHEQFQEEANQKLNQFQDAANQKLDLQTDKLDNQNESISKVIETIDQTLNALKSYETTYINSHQEISTELQEFINKATETNTSIYTENREWFEEINDANKQQFSDMQNQLKTELGIVQQTLNDQLGTLVTELGTNLSNLQKGLNGGLETLNDRLENFDTPLRDAVNHIRETFESQLETLNTRLENFDKPLQEAADQMRGTFRNLVRHMQTIVGDLLREVEKQNEKYEEQLTGVKNLNQDIVNLLKQLDESSNNQKDAVNTLSTNVNGLTEDIKNLDTAINTFTSDSGDLSQSIGAIKGDIEKLGTASQQFVEKVEKADVTPLTTGIEKLNTSINEISKHSETLADAVDRLARQEGSLGSGQKTKRPFFKIILNPLSWIWPFKKNTSETKNKNEEK